jgi:hypothetical protein
MCHATGANYELRLDFLVRTNMTSCIMLKIVKTYKLIVEPILFMCSLR